MSLPISSISHLHALAITLGLGMLCVGCSSDSPKTHSVSGRLLYQGSPVAGAQVGFLPAVNDSQVKPARGQTDADGRYTLSTYLKPGEESRGAMAGSFKVTVAESVAEKRIVGYDELANKKALLPIRYADVQTTPLTAVVVSGSDNTFDFTLKEVEKQ